MIALLSLVAIAAFCILLILDFKTNKANLTERYALRLLSCAGCSILIACDCLFSAPLEMPELVVDIAVADAILLMHPCSFEKPDCSLKAAAAVLTASITVVILFSVKREGTMSYRNQRLVWSIIAILVPGVVYFVTVAFRKFQGLRPLFRSSAVWHNVEDYSRFMHLMFYMALCVVALSSLAVPGDPGVVLLCLSFVGLLMMYCVLYLKAVSGRSYILNKNTEDRIKEMIKGNLRPSCVEKTDEDHRMNGLYKRIMDYMSEKKPYLDCGFDMTEMSERLFSNKLYLSKTINVLSGRNFRQFINYHRVQYAMDLMKQDPKLKVSEVSEMSGFHSVVSFNMAFKVNTGQTPSEWLRDFIAKRGFDF